jgi:hypothetical protein
MSRRSPLVLLAALAALGCRQNNDPEGARLLFAKVTEGPGYRSWSRAPGYSSRKPSFTVHADAVEIFVSPEISSALAGPTPVLQWPLGSIIVEEGYADGDLSVVAVVQKGERGWYWAEYDRDGDPLYSGHPTYCLHCHDKRKDYSDWVYSFELPR